MFARTDEIPSLPVENIKEKPKCRGRMDEQRENSIPTHLPQTQFAGGYNNMYDSNLRVSF